MDFFEKQARAQRRTGLLICYFLLAISGIVGTLHVAFALLFGYPLTDWPALAWVALGVTGAVFIGSVTKMIELSQGGRAVAAMLGGEPVDLNSVNADDRRLINVVEEMALASGVPVPELFVLPGRGINAFAAGNGPGDAVIGVTRGCVELLTRDELQGVVAHEFSHILHGDMRLNLRLMGLLNGILFLALLGGTLMRISVWTSDSDANPRSSKNSGSIGFVIVMSGLALYLVGWIGVFFGKLIKAAVSRQREFLADASAVQFTRNPDGLAGALAKIRKFSSVIESPHAEAASHMYFGNGTRDPILALLATHPPVEDRIREIAPGFDHEAVKLPQPKPSANRTPPPLPADGLVRPGFAEIATAAAILDGLPEETKTAVHELHGACAIIFALLASQDAVVRGRQFENIDEGLRTDVETCVRRFAGLDAARRLALVDLAIPTLRHLSGDQYTAFRAAVTAFIEADGEIRLFEFTLQKILTRHLDMAFTNAVGPAVRYRSLVPLLPDVSVVLSAFANVCGENDPDRAFHAGLAELLVKPSSFPMERVETIDLQAFNEALDKLAEAAPDVKRTVLTACGAVVMNDETVNDDEAQFLRAVADALDCPIPPFVRTA